MTKRDDFPMKTRRTLAIRAAHFCSNPDCLKLTAGPHSAPDNSLTTGHAAHIHAAAPGGPRFDPAQSAAQRKAATNGIWLCRECGDIVDKDDALHSAQLLTQWKINHESMISEVRTKGYADSIELLRSRRLEPALAKQVIALLEDRRALWEFFDAEIPSRVLSSLDLMRSRLVELRSGLRDGTPLDNIVLALTKTIHIFYRQVEHLDLATLRCESGNPKWMHFRHALATLRKAVGLQISNLASAYGIKLSSDLKGMTPTQP